MKTRNGFVSNSSSSSFIITVAEIIDDKKFQPFMEKMKDKWDWHFKILDKDNFRESNLNYDWSGYNGFNLKEFFQKNPDSKVFVKIGFGPEGDEYFWNDKNYEFDYDKIRLKDFDNVDIELYSMHEKTQMKNGIEILDTFYGAGRDG